MADIALDKVHDFEELFLGRMRASHKDALETLSAGKIDEGVEDVLVKVAAEVCSQINA